MTSEILLSLMWWSFIASFFRLL